MDCRNQTKRGVSYCLWVYGKAVSGGRVPSRPLFLCVLMNGTRSSRVALYAGTIPTRILSVRPDPRARDVEVVFRLDVVQMDEPLLPRLLHPDPGEGDSPLAVSYTHLTLPTNREV